MLHFSFLFIVLAALSGMTSLRAEQVPTLPDNDMPASANDYERRIPKYKYMYIDRDHTWGERGKHIGAVYGLTWLVYPLTQPDVVRENGSFRKYRRNFGQVVFDQDEPFWNWFVHPISGSQLFLLYRALGYTRPESMGLAFVSSTLFEFTVEIYTEPASVQDLYQTPVIGSIMGVGIENLSLYLLNTGNLMGRFFGHLINPATLFWFYEGKVRLTPVWRPNGPSGVHFAMEF